LVVGLAKLPEHRLDSFVLTIFVAEVPEQDVVDRAAGPRDDDDILVVTTKGKMIRFHAADVSSQGRNTWGVRIIDLEADDRAGSVARVDAESSAPVDAT
jgi:DNA gyrase/topoisomerase IV subunit A